MLDNRDTFDWLLNQETDTCNRSQSGPNKTYSVFNATAARGNVEIFDFLFLVAPSLLEVFVLHTAIYCKDAVKTTTVITHLIEKYHFDVNANDCCHGLLDQGFASHLDDGPPLNRPIVWGNIPAVQVLWKHKVNPSIGRSIIVYLGESGKSEKSSDLILLLKLLLEAGAYISHGLVESVN